jgi:hypothetical protein
VSGVKARYSVSDRSFELHSRVVINSVGDVLYYSEKRQHAELESLRIEEVEGETIAGIYQALGLTLDQQDARRC